MNLRGIAALAATVALSLTIAPAATGAAPASTTSTRHTSTRPIAKPTTAAKVRKIGSVSDLGEGIPAAFRHRKTDTASLYRQSGITPSKKVVSAVANSPASTSTSTATPAATNSAGQTLPPGLKDHVDQYCGGTGSDGDRVQVMYVREADTTDRYAQVVPVLRNETRFIDDVFAVSAKQTGGGRRVRWVTNADCSINVLNVVLPDGSVTGGFDAMEKALSDAGYLTTMRKYLAFADTSATDPDTTNEACGLGRVLQDSSPTNNLNDGRYPQVARVDSECWVTGTNTNAVPLHELLHTMGAVQPDAPHGTNGFHCTDMSEVMCYNDGYATPTQVCPVTNKFDIDCNKDDYFNTNPPAGSYLATHWNVANSPFLATVAPLPDPPTVTVTPSTTTPDAGAVVTFTAQADSTTTVTWSTDSPDCETTGAATTGTTYSIQCFEQAQPTVTATASNSGITTSSTNTTVTYASAESPTLTVDKPTSVQANTAFTMTASVANSSATWTYAWTLQTDGCTSNSSTTSAAVTVTCSAATQGSVVSFYVVANRTSNSDVLSTTFGVDVVAAGAPAVQVSGPDTVIAGQSATFTATTDATHAAFQWSSLDGFGWGSTNTAAFTVHPPGSMTGGSDSVFVTVTNTDTNTSTTITVPYDIAQAMAVAISGPSGMEPGNTGTYTVATSKPATVTWGMNQAACSLRQGSSNLTQYLSCPASFIGSVALTATAFAPSTEETVSTTKTVNVAQPKNDTLLSFTASTGYPSHMSATLTNALGTGISGRTLFLQTRSGNSWANAQVLTTGDNGSVYFDRNVNQATTFRVYFPGTNAYNPSVSTSRTLTIVTGLLNVKVKHGLKATLRTAWGAPITGTRIALQRKLGSRWVNIKAYSVNRHGKIKIKINPPKKTVYRWKYAGDSAHVGALSGTVTLK